MTMPLRVKAPSIADSVRDPRCDIADGKTRAIENQLGREFDVSPTVPQRPAVR
jgi:hypothetical protein